MSKFFLLVVVLFNFISCVDEPATNKIDALAVVTELSSPAAAGSETPALFTDKNGTVYLSWIQRSNDSSYLKFSKLSKGQWSDPVVIASGTNWFVNWADYPVLATIGNNMIAHFLEKNDTGKYTYDIRLIQSIDGGTTWSKAKTLHDDGKKAEHGFVSVMPDGYNFFFSWLDGRNSVENAAASHGEHHGEMTLRGAIVGEASTKLNEWELDARVCDCCQTSVAITANGPVVVYRDRSQSEVRDISIVRMVEGKWTSPTPVFSDNWIIDGCPVNGPKAHAFGNTLAVAWFTAPEKNAQVKVIFSDDGGASFGKPLQVDEGKPIGRVDLIMLDDKTAIISWMEGALIKARKVSISGEIGPAISIGSSSESRASGFPHMTLAGNNLYFAWTDHQTKSIKLASVAL